MMIIIIGMRNSGNKSNNKNNNITDELIMIKRTLMTPKK